MVATQLACEKLFVLCARTRIHRLCGMRAYWSQPCTATWHACQTVTPCTGKPHTCGANWPPLGTQQRPGSCAGPQEPQPAPQDSDRHQDATALPAPVIPEPAAAAAESPRPSQPPADDGVPPVHDDNLSTAGRQHETPNEDVAAAHLAGQALPRRPVRLTNEKGGGSKEQQLQVLREHVARVTETAACLPALDGNGAECEKVRASAGMAIEGLAVMAFPLCVMAGNLSCGHTMFAVHFVTKLAALLKVEVVYIVDCLFSMVELNPTVDISQLTV